MQKRHLALTVSILAIGAAAVSLYSGFTRRAPSIDLDPYQVLGAVVAEETAKLLGNQGQVIVIARDAKSESLEAELNAFNQTLKKSGGLSVLPADRVKLTPAMMVSGAVPLDELARTLQSHPNLGAVVLFFAFPGVADPDLDSLKRTGAKFVVVSGYRPQYRGLLERQAINLAIVPRPRSAAPPPATQTARTLRERFDQEYVILTPEAPAPLP
jgi:ABC-type sugar transport system substrate-binding protein